MEQKEKRTKPRFGVGLVFMLLSTIAAAAALPLTLSVKGDNPLVKLLWRMQEMMPFVIVCTYIEVKKQKYDINNCLKHAKKLFKVGVTLSAV